MSENLSYPVQNFVARSVGKSTVLNALLGEKYSEVSMKRTTAGINYFRVVHPVEIKREDDDDSDAQGQGKGATPGDVEIRSASSIHNEITKDNAKLRAANKIHEKNFDVLMDEPLFEMRDDTNLVLVDFPGINEAGTGSIYKDYVADNWKSFDCVVVVVDALQGANTDEQVKLLEFVKQNCDSKKDLPVIVLGNKIDDPDEEGQISQV